MGFNCTTLHNTNYSKCFCKALGMWVSNGPTETMTAPVDQAVTVPYPEFNRESKNHTPDGWFLAVWALETLDVKNASVRQFLG